MNDEEKSGAYVMLAIPQTEYDSARRFLRESGIHDVIACCWKHNSELIGLCYENWRQEVGNE